MKAKHVFRTIAIWTLISLALQFSVYALLNNSIAKVMNPSTQPGATPTASTPVATSLNAVLPDADPANVQISYDNNYLAYTTDNILKVFDLKQNKVVFTKEPETGSDANMGVLNYQWLSDRNSLIYFFAAKNSASTKSSGSESTKNSSTPAANKSSMATAAAFTSFGTNKIIAETVANSEDPNSANTGGGTAPSSVTVNNSAQITELFTLDLSNGSDSPNDRHDIDLNNFPAGGQILRIASSTYTNLIYVTIKTGSAVKLMEIDVMNNCKFLQLNSETITNIATSDLYGTLYFESQTGKSKQILALVGTQRKTVSKNSNYTILGAKNGKLYVGEINNDRLVKILTSDESSDNKTFELSQTWKGNIPYKDESVLIGSDGQVVVYSNQSVSIIQNGQVNTLTLNGDENYISSDGTEYIQLTPSGNQTKVILEPLTNSK